MTKLTIALVLISSVFYNERDSKPNLAEGGVNDILGYMQNFISEVNKGNISKYCDESDDVIQSLPRKSKERWARNDYYRDFEVQILDHN